MNRRSVLAGLLAATSLAVLPRSGSANTLPKLAVYRNPGCDCCEGWVQHMRAGGLECTIEDDPNLDARRANLGIPAELASCHIALAGGYAFEGHIPAADVVRFLSNRLSAPSDLSFPECLPARPAWDPRAAAGLTMCCCWPPMRLPPSTPDTDWELQHDARIWRHGLGHGAGQRTRSAAARSGCRSIGQIPEELRCCRAVRRGLDRRYSAAVL